MTVVEPQPAATDATASTRSWCDWLPWRSASLAWAITAVALLAGVPLFVRLPPWCDLTLYDLAARNLLHGGTLYKDIFDTNLPGFVWVLAGFRAVFGWSVEAVRLFDLAIVVGICLVLHRLAIRAGASAASAAWAVTGVALFYPFTTEFNHCQRDVWMLLPAAGATLLRVRRLCEPEPVARTPFRPAALEGCLWAMAVWIKPHVLIPAVAVWLATVPRAYRLGGWRGLLHDLAGNLAAGLALGLLGVVYLVASGTWPWFWEVFTFWNVGYLRKVLNEVGWRLEHQQDYFPPWTYLPALAIPLAVLCLIDGLLPGRRASPGPQAGFLGRWLPRWLWDTGSDDRIRVARVAVAAAYLGWTAQALFLQQIFHYVHVPEIMLLLFLLATQRWPGGFLAFLWLGLASAAVLLGHATADDTPQTPTTAKEVPFRLVTRHELTKPGRLLPWRECWRLGLSDAEYRRRTDAVARFRGTHINTDWEELGEVADWLKARNVRDNEVLCLHDSPHVLYLLIGTRPPLRFMHVSHVTEIGREQERKVFAELSESVGTVRYVVVDLLRPRTNRPGDTGDITLPGRHDPDDLLPLNFSPALRAEFPYYEKTVFRSGGGRGRYVVFAHDPAVPLPSPPMRSVYPPE